jgi:[acyl-carrier-protein] S-malonyltransferase
MAPAAERLARELENTDVVSPRFPVLSNVTAEPVGDPDNIRSLLTAQLTNPVRWSRCVQRMTGDGIATFYEFGPGKVLTGLLRRIAPSAACRPVDALGAIQSLSE